MHGRNQLSNVCGHIRKTNNTQGAIMDIHRTFAPNTDPLTLRYGDPNVMQ